MIPLSQLMVSSHNPQQLVARDTQRMRMWHEFSVSVAALVSELNNRAEQRWLLFEDDSYRFAIGLMALLHSGKQILLPPNAQPGTLVECASHCDALLGVTAQGMLSITINEAPVVDAVIEPDFFQALDAKQCFIEVLTSGSSGQARIIRKSLSCFEQELVCQQKLWADKLADSVVMSTVSHQHIYGLLFRLMLPLCNEQPFWMSTHQYPEPLFADMLKHCPRAVLISSPAHLGRLPSEPDLSPVSESLQCVFSSGGALALAAAHEIEKRLGQLPVEVFGSTETGGVAWRYQHTEQQPWKLFSDVMARAVEGGGVLQIKSPFCFDTHWYAMGDVAKFVGVDQFLLHGRADRIVKIEEKRLSLVEMEQRLQLLPWVEQARLIVLSGKRKPLAAVIVLSSSGWSLLEKQGKRQMNNHLKQQLSAYFERVVLPRKWRYPKQMPMNSQGKITVQDLTKLFETAA